MIFNKFFGGKNHLKTLFQNKETEEYE